jgi:DtxR family transcriptional regulator, Mn-dependent transcriptional regulator
VFERASPSDASAIGREDLLEVSDLIDTTEMYLRTIFELEEEGIVALRARIAQRLGHSGPTVSQTVARMERDGLVHVTGDRHLELTAEGRVLATRVMRKHRLAERLLLDVIGLEWELVHLEACRWEHVIGDRVERKLITLLGDLQESPYGNPIPGLEELGGPPQDAADFRREVLSLAEVLVGPPGIPPGTRSHPVGDIGTSREGPEVDLVIRRLGEPIQSDIGLLTTMAEAGIRPGRRVSACRTVDTVRVTGRSGTVCLSPDVVGHVFVTRFEAVRPV